MITLTNPELQDDYDAIVQMIDSYNSKALSLATKVDMDEVIAFLESELTANYNDGEEMSFKEFVSEDYGGKHWDTESSSLKSETNGGEGQGEDYTITYEFINKNTGLTVIIEANGWYSSYEGPDMSEATFTYSVAPKLSLENGFASNKLDI